MIKTNLTEVHIRVSGGRRGWYYKFQFQMKSRLSIEIKGLLEHKKLGASRYDPDSSSNITTTSTNKPLKRSESSSTLRRTDTDISIIEDRYRLLQRNYRDLLEETKLKGELFRKQREELDRLRQVHDRDQKEIAQLRTLLEIARRNQLPAQASMQQSQIHPNKPQKSSASVPKERRSPIKAPPAGLAGGSAAGGLRKNSRVRLQSQSRGGFSKYKFVPSVPLH